MPTNSSQEIHVRRPCSALSRPLPTCSCSALRGVCGSTGRCHHPASASLTHKQDNAEHHCRELSGQVPGAGLPSSHQGRSREGCGGPRASLRDGCRAPGWMGLERRACAERRETPLCLHQTLQYSDSGLTCFAPHRACLLSTFLFLSCFYLWF